MFPCMFSCALHDGMQLGVFTSGSKDSNPAGLSGSFDFASLSDVVNFSVGRPWPSDGIAICAL